MHMPPQNWICANVMWNDFGPEHSADYFPVGFYNRTHSCGIACLSLCFIPYFSVRIINTASSRGVLKYFMVLANDIMLEYLLSSPGSLYLNLCRVVKVKLISDQAEELDWVSSSPISSASEETRVIAADHILEWTLSDCWLCGDRSRGNKDANTHLKAISDVLCCKCNVARRIEDTAKLIKSKKFVVGRKIMNECHIHKICI